MEAAATAPALPPRAPRRKAPLKTFDHNTYGANTNWDSLRRDPQLFVAGADCSVYLFAEGHSKRGPAFQVPSSDLVERQCTPLLAIAREKRGTSHASAKSGASGKLECSKYELYLPPPPLSQRDDAFQWHVTTRNFFAWMRGKPLVGEHLGVALADLLNRMCLWRPEASDVAEEVLIYADNMGYTAVEGRPDLALAMLYFGEAAKLRNVWIDAFVHCVGMNSVVSASSEFKPVSEVTKALITKKSLEMDLHLSRAANALGNFLEEELSAAHLGLGNAARQELDIFRGFLISHHVATYGYWPPPKQAAFPKDFYQGLYNEISHLYNYLADKRPLNPSRSVSGGICVQQNVEAFNSRQKYEPLPYSLPLLPDAASSPGVPIHKSIFVLRKSGSSAGFSRVTSCRDRLRAATNQDQFISDSPLVQQYILFEDEQATKPTDKVSASDARKVRWLLIYGVLQTLISTITAPPEVRETQSTDYPTCVSTAGIPSWEKAVSIFSDASASSPGSESGSSLKAPKVIFEIPSTPIYDIHPDCETEHYFDYLPTSNGSAHNSTTDLSPTATKQITSRGSFLRKASTLRRRSNTLPPNPAPPRPQLVFGRTLAELAYGDLSYGDPSQIPSLDEVSPSKLEFRFPFSPQPERADDPEVETQIERSVLAEVKPLTEAPYEVEPRPLAIDTQRTEKGLGIISFDDRQLLLPSDQAPSRAYTAYEHSPTDSIPSLSFSHSSSASSDENPSPNAADSTIPSRETSLTNSATSSRESSVKRVHFDFPQAEEPGKSMRFSFAQPEQKGKSVHFADDEAHNPAPISRSDVVTVDGHLDQETIDMYRSLCI